MLRKILRRSWIRASIPLSTIAHSPFSFFSFSKSSNFPKANKVRRSESTCCDVISKKKKKFGQTKIIFLQLPELIKDQKAIFSNILNSDKLNSFFFSFQNLWKIKKQSPKIFWIFFQYKNLVHVIYTQLPVHVIYTRLPVHTNNIFYFSYSNIIKNNLNFWMKVFHLLNFRNTSPKILPANIHGESSTWYDRFPSEWWSREDLTVKSSLWNVPPGLDLLSIAFFELSAINGQVATPNPDFPRFDEEPVF